MTQDDYDAIFNLAALCAIIVCWAVFGTDLVLKAVLIFTLWRFGFVNGGRIRCNPRDGAAPVTVHRCWVARDRLGNVMARWPDDQEAAARAFAAKLNGEAPA